MGDERQPGKTAESFPFPRGQTSWSPTTVFMSTISPPATSARASARVNVRG